MKIDKRVWLLSWMIALLFSATSLGADVQVQWLGSSSLVSEALQMINDEEKIAEGKPLVKVTNGLMFSWAPSTSRTKSIRRGSAITLDYYTLAENNEECIEQGDGSCIVAQLHANGLFLGYSYQFTRGIYLLLAVGLSGGVEEVTYGGVNGRTEERIERVGVPPYGLGLGYAWTQRRSGFTVGARYFWTPTAEYEFDQVCTKRIRDSESCSTAGSFAGNELSKPKEFSYSVLGFTVGWTI